MLLHLLLLGLLIPLRPSQLQQLLLPLLFLPSLLLLLLLSLLLQRLLPSAADVNTADCSKHPSSVLHREVFIAGPHRIHRKVPVPVSLFLLSVT